MNSRFPVALRQRLSALTLMAVVVCAGIVGTFGTQSAAHADEPRPSKPGAFSVATATVQPSQPSAPMRLPESSAASVGSGGIGLNPVPAWFSAQPGLDKDAAWGDVDGDGDLDLAVVGAGRSRLYLNDGGMLEELPHWTSTENYAYGSTLAWGDIDGDGDLDLIVGSTTDAQPGPWMHENRGGQLEREGTWTADAFVWSVALGDVEGDGDLDLVGASTGGSVLLFDNQNGTLSSEGEVIATVPEWAYKVALADMDSDQDLDLALGHWSGSAVYRNGGSDFDPSPIWTAGGITGTIVSVAWGDVDSDGDPDLAIGSREQMEQVRLFRNELGVLEETPAWIGQAPDASWDEMRDLEWGDGDSDGDLDLLVAAINNPIHVYQNTDGVLGTAPVWKAADKDYASAVAWGDVDGDGDLDAAAVHDPGQGSISSPAKLFRNESSRLGTDISWSDDSMSATAPSITSVAWGDVDGDGDLDLATGYTREQGQSRPNGLYLNEGGILITSTVWEASNVEYTNALAWGDVDGDGDLDLAAANGSESQGGGQPSLIYLNINGTLTETGLPISPDIDPSFALAWGDVDDDGDLDLAVGNRNAYVGAGGDDKLYLNMGGTFSPTAVWQTVDADFTYSIAWGDVDGDGDLDLATGNYDLGDRNGGVKLYLNAHGRLSEKADWHSADRDSASASIAWGDVDGDGDLDLVSGNMGQPKKLYRNIDGMLEAQAAWSSADSDPTKSIALGDVDGDGDLDLVAGHTSQPLKAYLNIDGQFQRVAGWINPNNIFAWDVDLGDVDGDGDLDLALAHFDKPSLLLTGTPGLPTTPRQSRQVVLSRHSQQVATANGVTTLLDPANLYATPWIRSSRTIPISYTLFEPNGLPIREVRASFSPDGGGRWYPAVAASGTVTMNLPAGVGILRGAQHGLPAPLPAVGTRVLTMTLPSVGPIAEVEVWVSVAHLESDELDLFLRSPSGTEVELFSDVSDISLERFWLSDRAWRSVIVGPGIVSGPYRPEGRLQAFQGESSQGTWSLVARDDTAGTAGTVQGWGLQLRGTAPTHVYHWDVQSSGFLGKSDNVVFRLEAFPSLRSPVGGVAGSFQQTRVGTQSYPFRVRGNQIRVISGTQPIENAQVYRLQAGQAVGGALLGSAEAPFLTDQEGFLQGRGAMRVGDQLLALAPVPTPTPPPSAPVCTLYPSTDLPKRIPDDVTPAVVTSTLEVLDARTIVDVNVRGLRGTHTWLSDLTFELRSPSGTEVTLIESSCADADDFNLSLDDEATSPGPCPPTTGETYLPIGQLSDFDDEGAGGIWTLEVIDDAMEDGGSLDGWGLEICVDTAPPAPRYTEYATNGTPTSEGVDSFTIASTGIQTLTVSAEKPLILFDIGVSLEWDAHEDESYLEQLRFDLERASAMLYDFTDGQVALGDVQVAQNGDEWTFADVVVHATNRMRPWANQGGLVTAPVTDSQHADIVYTTGQVRMGATWNRYGTPGGNVGEDWPLILAHELAHYLLFQEDVYLGLNPEGYLVAVDSCTGSAMGDVYRSANTELIFDTAWWNERCGNTLAAQSFGRTEWQTLKLWYPWLRQPTTRNPGPSHMPFDLTNVTILDPIAPRDVIDDPTFYLNYGSGVSSSEAKAFLIRDDKYVIDLGNPVGGQNRLLARGAQSGDRLCVFDRLRAHYGCETVESGDDQLLLEGDPTWQPLVKLTPVVSTTFGIRVENLPAGLTLRARLFPEFGPGTAPITLTASGNGYGANFQLLDVTMSGKVQLWVEENATEINPRRETMVAFSIGGNPGLSRGSGGLSRGSGGLSRGSGGLSRGSGGLSRGSGGLSRGSGAPLVSPDGQMTFFTPNPIIFQEGQFYTIQGMAGLPAVPPGRSVIGQGYQLVATTGTPVITGSVSFQYLSGDVQAANADEASLKVYFYDGAAWRSLPTLVDPYFNIASARSAGIGIYALMSSMEIPLRAPGWNLFSYPIRASRPVTEALRSISGHYSQVYGYYAEQRDDPWKLYDVSVPSWVNDLTQFDYGRGYWIRVTTPITIHMDNEGTPGRLAATSLPLPPSTFYGAVLGSGGFTPTAGMPVTALVGNVVCGGGVTRLVGEQVVFTVDVAAESPERDGCGATGRVVRFRVGSREMLSRAMWSTERTWQLDLRADAPYRLVLPFVGKR